MSYRAIGDSSDGTPCGNGGYIWNGNCIATTPTASQAFADLFSPASIVTMVGVGLLFMYLRKKT